MWKQIALAAALSALVAGCAMFEAERAAAPAQPECQMSAADQAWIERALAAWRFTSREITQIHVAGNFQAVFFDASCMVVSPNALTNADTRSVTWTATPHGATVTLPDGEETGGRHLVYERKRGQCLFCDVNAQRVARGRRRQSRHRA